MSHNNSFSKSPRQNFIKNNKKPKSSFRKNIANSYCIN